MNNKCGLCGTLFEKKISREKVKQQEQLIYNLHN